MKKFDRIFGPEFIGGVPPCPGVYRIFNENDRLIYVGKAKNLKRRLGQYRNAKRTKRDRKMQRILKGARKIVWQTCETELEAILLETTLIQENRPKWNVVGAFSFLYPLIGMKAVGSEIRFLLTTLPDEFPGFEFHGAFRSREITGEAFFALMRLMKYVAHPVPRKKLEKEADYSYLFGFRQLPAESVDHWSRFFRGESMKALEELILLLVENAAARKSASEVQDELNLLRRFWRHEASLLRKAREKVEFSDYPVPQRERDPLFLRYRAGNSLKEGVQIK